MKRDGSVSEEHVRELPPPPPHGFVGRAAELRDAAEQLPTNRYLVIRGEHGEGKTTLACELARQWLDSGRVARVAYVSFEVCHDGSELRFALGQQLVPSYRLAASQDQRFALRLLERVLQDVPTLVIFDDMEVVLPPSEDSPMASRVYEPTVLDQVLVLASELRKIGRTSLLFASTEPLPEPFHESRLDIAGLDVDSSIDLVRGVLTARGAESEAAPSELEPLASGVDYHAGSLVALAGELATSGLAAASRTLAESHAAIGESPFEGRGRLLALGAEIALRGFPKSLRGKLPLLEVFRGGGHLTAIAAVLELDVENDEEINLAESLIGAGLAEMLPNNYLRFHPALREALRVEVQGREQDTARDLWVEATTQLVDFLCQEQIKSPQLAAQLTQLDLRNLLACLEVFAEQSNADQVVEFAGALESLVGPLHRPEALGRIDQIREQATARLSEWNHQRYLAESADLEWMMDAGRPEETVATARRLLHRAETVGADAYEGADFDLATLHFTLGLALLMAGDSELAAGSFEEARGRFNALGHAEAARMEAQALARTGDALRASGFRTPSSEAYQRAIELAEQLGDLPLVAEIKTRLGELRLSQNRIQEALGFYEQARDLFVDLSEPQAVAGIWHQIGLVYQNSGQLEEAEKACRQALKLELDQGDRHTAATTLGELGSLRADSGMASPAVESFRGAAELFAELGDLEKEGIARSQMADKLIQLGRFDEARVELQRTVECDQPFGHIVQPWRTFSMLLHLEETVGNHEAMLEARARAVQTYLSYRREGGGGQVGHGEIFAEVTQAILAEQTAEVTAKLEGMSRRGDLPAGLKTLIPVLQAVLGGSRDKNLAADARLYYRDAAELLLQLETLEGARARVSDVVF